MNNEPHKVSEEMYELAIWLDIHLDEVEKKLSTDLPDEYTKYNLLGYAEGLKFTIRSILNPLSWDEPNWIIVPDDPENPRLWVEIAYP